VERYYTSTINFFTSKKVETISETKVKTIPETIVGRAKAETKLTTPIPTTPLPTLITPTPTLPMPSLPKTAPKPILPTAPTPLPTTPIATLTTPIGSLLAQIKAFEQKVASII
jgi:hypothetical protein